MRKARHSAEHRDVVSKMVDFQITGQGFGSVWREVGPIVEEFARVALRKKGLTSPAGGDDHAVGDVVNETAIRLMGLAIPGASGRFDPAKASRPGLSGLRGWLWRIVERQASDWARSHRWGRGPTFVCESALVSGDPADDGASSILDQHCAVVERPDLLPILQSCIARLEEPFHRDIVRLKLDEELSLRGTAARLGVPVTRVQRQLCRALGRLRDMLDDGRLDGTWLAA